MVRLGEVLLPPSWSGPVVDWDGVAEEFGWRLPADYRDFVGRYGPGAVSDSLAIFTPPFPGYPFADHLLYQQEHLATDGLLRWGMNEVADDLYWRCGDQDPDRWTVAVRLRAGGWLDYDLGMVDFLTGLLTGRIDVPLDASLSRSPAWFPDMRP